MKMIGTNKRYRQWEAVEFDIYLEEIEAKCE